MYQILKIIFLLSLSSGLMSKEITNKELIFIYNAKSGFINELVDFAMKCPINFKINNIKNEFVLNENESTYIPPETMHRLENASDNILEIIEVQSGSYLGEDDIVRHDDDFGR